MGFSRVTNLGKSGRYTYGQGFDLAGFVLRLLPHAFRDGDCVVAPYAAVVIPYWATTTVLSLLLLWVSGLGASLRPHMRFSRYSVGLMGVLCVAFVVANVFPWTTYDDGVLRLYGFPATFLTRAVQGDEVLTFYGGYSLGWRQRQLAEDSLLAIVVVVAAGVCVEFVRHKFVLTRC
jgi:hypothetical protein